MEIKQTIERIAKLREQDIGSTEENVKRIEGVRSCNITNILY